MATAPHTQETLTVDATGKRLGRVASEAAHLLLGKHRTDAVRHTVAPVSVTITNVARIVLDERKRDQKEYDWYSGYPDGRRTLTLKELIARKGMREVVRKAVYGMMPGNRLRAPRMKRLTITD